MNGSLSAAGRSMVRAFIGAILIYAPGVLAAPDLPGALTLAAAALGAGVAASIRGVQAYIPQLSVGHYLPENAKAFGAYIDSFLRAFIGSLVVIVPDWLDTGDFSHWRTFAISALVGAGTLAVKAVEDLFTKGRGPVKALGLPEPKKP